MLEINDHGRLVISKPFSIPDLVYTVSGKMLLSDLVASGIDAYALIYETAGYTIEQFNRAISDNPIILILRGTDGSLVYAPEAAVLIKDEDFREYSEKAILLHLGPLDTGSDLKDMVKSLEDTVLHSIGVKPTTIVERVSAAIPVSEREHELIMSQRTLVSKVSGSLEQQLSETLDHNEVLIAQVNSLLMFIKHYLRTCCSKDICFNYAEGNPVYVHYAHEINHYVAVEESGGNPFSGETNAWVSYLRRWHSPDTI